ncbi:MAG: VOC family protein [bacterium]|nr:VOC family protein [bacterium]
MAKVNSIPVWRDLYTRDRDRSVAFYTELFGWRTKVFPMGELGDYTMFLNGERPFGGLEVLDGNDSRPSRWHIYISVEDVDKTTAKAVELGGKVVLPPTDIPTVGRYSIIADPVGITSCPFTGEEEGQPPATPGFGDFCWEEIVVRDTTGLQDFYGKLYAWSGETSPMAGAPYTVFSAAGKDIVGLMAAQAEDHLAPYWQSYVVVESVEESLVKAEKLGAKVVVPPMDIPDVGRIAILLDPEDNTVGIWAKL